MRTALAFFKRDALMALSYRASFAMQIIGSVIFVIVFCFLGKALDSGSNPVLARYGNSMTAYILIGVALADCVGLSLTAFSNHIREGQLTGTLALTLASPTPLPLVLIYSSIWPYFFCAIRFIIFLIAGSLLFGVDLQTSGLPAALLIFVLTVVAFMGVGILWASAVVLIKRGEALQATFSFLIWMLSGVLYPEAMLPAWMQPLSKAIPLTTALDGMRLALLKGMGFADLSGRIFGLAAYAAVLMVVGLIAFNISIRTARESGSLASY